MTIDSGVDGDILVDVTRPIWRAWRGRHPTGIDRVCLAYLEHFRGRALAVIQRKGFVFVLPREQSRKLFDLLLAGRGVRKAAIFRALARAISTARRAPFRKGMRYLNVGHTGLNDRALADWIARHEVKAVHLVHDLIPISNPEFCRPGESAKHRERMANALDSAAGIIGNSQATIDELTKFAAGRSTPMPEHLIAWISGFSDNGAVRPKSLERPYFVAVGTIEARKNHLMLLQAWRCLVAELGAAAPMLVVVGQPGWEADEALEILASPGVLAGHVLRLSDCDDHELVAWIAGARALLMPSLAEGYGLPVVEALSLGTPVIASDLPVFREIAGDIPTYLSPRDENAWRAHIRAFTGGDPERERQLKRMTSYRAPTWNEHFQVVEDWLATL